MNKLSKETREDLGKSGLNPQAVKSMQIRNIEADELYDIFHAAYAKLGSVDKKTLPKVPAYEIPYFTPNGNLSGYYRYKLLDEYRPPKNKKPAKYLQLPGTKPCFYFPPFVNWASINTNARQEIYITEGEKKAAALTLLGFPTVGIGGVWNWKSSEDDFSDPISDFNLINWDHRKTVIVFDTDV